MANGSDLFSGFDCFLLDNPAWLDEAVPTEEASWITGVPACKLATWRSRGGGPNSTPRGQWAAANDYQAGAAQSGEDSDLALWSKRCLIPLVKFLARRAAEDDFEKAANDNKQQRSDAHGPMCDLRPLLLRQSA